MPIDPYYFLQGMTSGGISSLPATGMFSQQMAPGLGAPGLFDLAQSSAYRAPFNPNNRFVDTRPLANFGLESYGMFGQIGGIAGNYLIQQQLAANGLTSRGNAGSYRQAMEVNERARARAQMVGQLRGLESDSINSVLQGFAAQTGFMGPMGEEQAAATRQFADFAAQYMPSMAGVPGFDTLSKLMTGRTGSIYPMVGSFAEANRFSRDPLTGQRGFSGDSNAAMIRDVYSGAFRDDSAAIRNGFRAEDYGQMYRELSAEGLIGTKGSLRDRTVAAAREVMKETGVDLPQLVSAGGGGAATATSPEELTAEQLQAVRRTSQVQTKLTKGEAKQVTDQLDSYGESIAAIKEVFLENGQEAPIPTLINALKALTNNQLGKFSPGQLTTIVRDLQAMSRVTGQSIDELFLMRQTAESVAKQYMGNRGQNFVSEMTKYGAAADAAYQEQGAMTGPNALSREQVRASAIDMAGRAANSDMVNMYSTVGRMTQATGGFEDNAAGRRLKAAYAAASASQTTYTYTDETGKEQTARTPTRIEELFPLLAGATKLTESQLLVALNQKSANQDFAAQHPELVESARNAVLSEFRERTLPSILAGGIGTDSSLSFIQTPEQRRAAASAISTALVDGLTEEERKNPELVTRRLVEAAEQGLAANGLPSLSPQQRKSLTGFVAASGAIADVAADQATNLAGGKVAGLVRTSGKAVQRQEAAISAEAGLSRAFAGVGQLNGGDLFSRLSTWLQSSGKNGQNASLDSLAPEVFAIDPELKNQMGAIKEEYAKYQALQSQLADATSEDDIRSIKKQLVDSQKNMTALVDKSRSQYLKSGAAYLPSELGVNLPGFGGGANNNLSTAFNVAELEAAMRGLPAKQTTSLEEHAASLMAGVEGDTFEKKLATIADPAAREKMRTDSLAAAWKQQTLRGQLQSAGALDPSAGDSPIRSREELLRQLPPTSELRNMLSADEAEAKRTNQPVKAWEKTAAEYLEIESIKDFGLPAAELAKKQAQLRQGVDKTVAQTLADEFSSVRNFLVQSNEVVAKSQDKNVDNALRGSAVSGVSNADEIKAIADKYFGGNVGTMFATKGEGITDEGRAALEAEFNGMTDAQRADLIKPLELNGFRFKPGQLPTFEQYQAMPALNLKRHLGEVNKSVGNINAASGKVPGLQSVQNSMTADLFRQAAEFVKNVPQLFKRIDAGEDPLAVLKDFAAQGGEIPGTIRDMFAASYGATREAFDEFVGGDKKSGSLKVPAQPAAKAAPAAAAAPPGGVGAATAVPPVTTTSNDGSGQSTLKLTGTVNVVGDITGRMSFTELTTSKA